MSSKIQMRRAGSSQWASVDPILAQGEFGLDTDIQGTKMGDGSTSWTNLSWHSISGTVLITSTTPTLAQGATTDIAKTIDYAKYSIASNVVSFQAKLTATAAGTTASAVTVSLPVTAAASAVGMVVGSGYYNDGGTQYQAVAYLASATTVALLSTHGTASSSTDDPIGVNPNIAVASTDIINLAISYEAA